jgi:dimeric dUTPase (all-alpha-NTP-PPase superfamily)
MKDKLDEIYNKQLEFQLKYSDKLLLQRLSASSQHRQEYVLEMVDNLIEELVELRRELPFRKNWSSKKYWPVDWKAAKEEYADCLHFFINIGIGLALTPDLILQHYTEKHQINIDRQGENKC